MTLPSDDYGMPDGHPCKQAGCRKGSYTSGLVTSSWRIWMNGFPCVSRVFHNCGRDTQEFVIKPGDPWIRWWESAA